MFVEYEFDSKTHPEKILYKNNQDNFRKENQKNDLFSQISKHVNKNYSYSDSVILIQE